MGRIEIVEYRHQIHSQEKGEETAEPFFDIADQKLRDFLTGFTSDQLIERDHITPNRTAARRVVSYVNSVRTKCPELEFQKIDEDTLATFEIWVSESNIIRFTPNKMVKDRYTKGVDKISLNAYAALAWGLATANEGFRMKGQNINRQSVLQAVINGIGEKSPLYSEIAVNEEEQKIFMDDFRKRSEAMIRGEEMVREPIVFDRSKKEKEEKKKLLVGEIPVIQGSYLENLAAWDPGRLRRIQSSLRWRESDETEQILSEELVAAVEFVCAYKDAKLQNYNPFPEIASINIHEITQKLHECADLIEVLQQKGMKVDTLADLYRGFARGANEDGFVPMHFEYHDTTDVDTNGKGT